MAAFKPAFKTCVQTANYFNELGELISVLKLARPVAPVHLQKAMHETKQKQILAVGKTVIVWDPRGTVVIHLQDRSELWFPKKPTIQDAVADRIYGCADCYRFYPNGAVKQTSTEYTMEWSANFEAEPMEYITPYTERDERIWLKKKQEMLKAVGK